MEKSVLFDDSVPGTYAMLYQREISSILLANPVILKS